MREDIRNIILVLGHSRAEDINCPYSKDDGRTALHIAAALGNVVYVQLLLWVSTAPYYCSAPDIENRRSKVFSVLMFFDMPVIFFNKRERYLVSYLSNNVDRPFNWALPLHFNQFLG